MDYVDIHIRETDDPCNCPWMECPQHKDNLCAQNAAAFTKCLDPDCKTTHYLGDWALGEGIHLCRPCAEAIINVFNDEVIDVMQEFSQYIPSTLRPLETMVKRAYKTKVGQPGWLLPYEDAGAVLGFAYLVINHLEMIAQPVPVAMIEKVRELIRKCKSIADAFTEVTLGKETTPQ